MMVKVSLTVIAALCLFGASPALAHMHRHHHRMHHPYRHDRRHAAHRGPYVIGYGETILSGRTGLHRNLIGVMVPDGPAGESDDFILTGRRRGSGLGANGLPGVNHD